VVSNLSAATGPGTYFGLGSSTVYKALGFRAPQPTKLDAVTLTLDFGGGGAALVSIWQGANAPQSQVVAMTGPAQSGHGDFQFVPVTPVVLQANVTYWVYIQSVLNPTATFWWDATTPSTIPTGTGLATEFVFNGAPSSTRNRLRISGTPVGCYANCDGVGGLTGNDFQCFLSAYINAESYANCDGVGGLTPNDFLCYLDKYVAGCS